MKDGVLLINKPVNWTSRDVVNKICQIKETKKVGHTGTLDPLATGVLVVCLGKYTKLVQELTNEYKEYVAVMRLGYESDTQDITGNVIQTKSVSFSDEQLREVFKKFPKKYEQTVPIYSAVKVQGKKLYEYAREGKKVSLPKRSVEILELELLKREGEFVTFRCLVSKGTYIRSLIVDIAAMLDTKAVMVSLVRTKQGDFALEKCYDLGNITLDTPLLHLEDLFSFSKIPIDEVTYQKVKNGNKISLPCQDEKVFLCYQGKVVALYQKDGEIYRFIFKA